MRSEKEAYLKLREWGYSHQESKAIAKGLYDWANKPDEKENKP